MLDLKRQEEEHLLAEGLDLTQVDEDQICKTVLGEKPGYVNLRGPLPLKGTRSSSSNMQVDNEIQQQVQLLEQMVENQQKLLEETQQQLASQKIEHQQSLVEFEKNQRELIQKIMAEFIHPQN